MKLLPLTILILFLLTGCASTAVSGTFGRGKQDVHATIDIPLTLDQKKQLATDLGVVYVGMPRRFLARAGYTEVLQKSYYKEDNEEWITFSNWTTKKRGDVVTFYLVDGKVKGWKGE